MTWRIMVIDDNRDFRAVIQRRLEKDQRFAVVAYTTVEEALIQIATRSPDVILLDWLLDGDLQGFRAIGEIRNLSRAPILIVSGMELDDEVLQRLHTMNVAALRKGPRTVGVDFPLVTKILLRIARTGLVAMEPGWVE